jgi:hypothetical protein
MEDPTIEKLEGVHAELVSHRERLRLRAAAVTSRAASTEDPEKKELFELIAESFSEQVDTGLDFHVEVVETILADLKNAGGEGDAEEVGGIEPDDSRIIMRSLVTLRSLLDAYPATDDPKHTKEIQKHKAQCSEAIELVEALTLDDDDDDDEEGDDDEAEAESSPGDRPS